MRIYNKSVFKEKRQILRKKETPAEKILWARLRSKQLNGWHFNRQYGAGLYILDFYCPKAKLAVELYGAQHRTVEGREYDADRKRYLEGLQIKTLRFWNDEVINNLDKVIETISSALPFELKRE